MESDIKENAHYIQELLDRVKELEQTVEKLAGNSHFHDTKTGTGCPSIYDPKNAEKTSAPTCKRCGQRIVQDTCECPTCRIYCIHCQEELEKQ